MQQPCSHNHTAEKTPLLHAVSGRSLLPPWPDGMQEAAFAMGCFWGAERLFWQAPGVWVSMVGYAGGDMESPDYESVCTGATGHAETVRVVFDPDTITYRDLLALFWENHDPTQGMRQGNDRGSQYRSMIFTANDEQKRLAHASFAPVQEQLTRQGLGSITTQIAALQPFAMAEDDHQQYLAKNPDGYCNLKGTGLVCTL